MSDRPEKNPPPENAAAQILRTSERKAKARRQGQHNAWFGLGMFGLVGWAVALPTLLGIMIGLWLDAALPSDFSWTLALLLGGVALGCINALWWVSKEAKNDR